MTHTKSLTVDPEREAHIWQLLYSQFGIPKLVGYRFLKSGRKRIRLISDAAFMLLSELPYTGTTGLYIGEYSPTAFRLSMDGAQLLGGYATKQIVHLTELQAETWLRGESVNYEDDRRGYVIVTHNSTILGCGSLSYGTLRSYVPKIRRPERKKE
jgi:NOL1/NOP2/fmu family ribosome biogenesis protein